MRYKVYRQRMSNSRHYYYFIQGENPIYVGEETNIDYMLDYRERLGSWFRVEDVVKSENGNVFIIWKNDYADFTYATKLPKQ